MILVRLETGDERFVGNVEIMPFLEAPAIVIWGDRFFILKYGSPHPLYENVKAIYTEVFAAISFTSGARCMELSQ
jgi:hypothetical protein